MKISHVLLAALLTAFVVACRNNVDPDRIEYENLCATLDEELAKSKEYEDEKLNRIAALRREYDLSTDKLHSTELINKIIYEFEAYNADSALYYISYNLQRPAVKAVPGQYTRLLIKRADVYAHAGLFADALSTIQAIPRDSLGNDVLEDYYATCSVMYQFLSEYTNEHETAKTYEQLRSLYADSLRMVTKSGTLNYLLFVTTEEARNGQPGFALHQLHERLDRTRSGTREYSMLASTMAYIYKTRGMMSPHNRFLLKSAISDVQGAVKENMSFREVAAVMFKAGDVERAHRYLQKSIADANFYSALMRHSQSSKMLPMIDEAYSTRQTQLSGRLRVLAVVSGVLSAVLLVTLFLTIKQFRNLRKAKDKVSRANEELSRVSEQLKETNGELKAKNEELNELSTELKATNSALSEKNAELSRMSEQLQAANSELKERNAELRELSRTKEQYAGLFMEYSSSAISTLQRYQLSLRNLAMRGVEREALLKKLESTSIYDRLFKDFYVKFDEAVLNIYPSFVEKFNALLRPDEQITLKAGELLNTELRLFALIRIGIDDNETVAQFLRCTISTIYTYRSKMKRRAINPETFENDVRNIS